MAYPTNTNKRVFYATQAVAVGDIGATSLVDSWQPGDSALDTVYSLSELQQILI